MKGISKSFTIKQIDYLKVFLLKQNLIKSNTSKINITPFLNGFSNLTYLLEIEKKEFVLRRPPKGAIKRGHDMSREYNVLSNLIKEFKKIPKVYCFSEDEKISGSPFYIMERIKGIILTNKEVENRKINANEFKIISKQWLDTFIELHKVNYIKAGLSELGKPEKYVERQVKNWSQQYIKAATEDIPQANKIINWINNNHPIKYDSCLIHNDYKYDNVVFKNRNWNEINAVLDWEMSTIGDPLMDLGTSIAYWTTNKDSPLLINNFPSPTKNPGNPSREEIVNNYSNQTGRSINNLVFYYAFGLFKIAVIVQQIYYRYKKGFTTNKKFANLNEATKFFCLMAWQAIQKKRIEKLF